MPKLSLAKRHRRQNNLAAYCCQESLVKSPRKVSDEDIQNNDVVYSPPSSATMSCVVSLSDWRTSRQTATTAESSSSWAKMMIPTDFSSAEPSTPTLKRIRKPMGSLLARRNPSNCLADLASASNHDSATTPYRACDVDWESASSPTPIPCAGVKRNASAMKSSRDGHHDVDGSVSPIWGHFVDVISEQEEEGCFTTEEDPLTRSMPCVSNPLSAAASNQPCPTFHTPSPRMDVRSMESAAYSPYYPFGMANKNSRKKARQKIVSPRALIIDSSTDLCSAGAQEILPDFVLHDPSTLPEDLARLKV